MIEINSELDLPFLTTEDVITWINGRDLSRDDPKLLAAVWRMPGVKEALLAEVRDEYGSIAILKRELPLWRRLCKLIGLRVHQTDEDEAWLYDVNLDNVRKGVKLKKIGIALEEL